SNQHGVDVPALQRKIVDFGRVDHFRYSRLQCPAPSLLRLKRSRFARIYVWPEECHNRLRARQKYTLVFPRFPDVTERPQPETQSPASRHGQLQFLDFLRLIRRSRNLDLVEARREQG